MHFTSVNDQTGLSNNAEVMSSLTAVLGVCSCLFTVTGYESCAHVAEETHDARTSAPWGIAGTVLCIATFGLVFYLGILCNSRYHSFSESSTRDLST